MPSLVPFMIESYFHMSIDEIRHPFQDYSRWEGIDHMFRSDKVVSFCDFVKS